MNVPAILEPVQLFLTPRDRQIGRRVVAGQTTEQMAAEMGLEEEVIAGHLRGLFKRTGTSTSGQLAASWPALDPNAGAARRLDADAPDAALERQQLTLERNAYRQLCRELQQAFAFLTGRPLESALEESELTELRVERDALRAMLQDRQPAGPSAAA